MIADNFGLSALCAQLSAIFEGIVPKPFAVLLRNKTVGFYHEWIENNPIFEGVLSFDST